MAGVTDEQREAFLVRTREIAGVINGYIRADGFIKVISHNDADGLSSAGILGAALTHARAHFQIHIVEELTDAEMENATSGATDLYIFSDIGSGYMPLLLSHHAEPAVILDHHPPSAPPSEKMHQLNPHDFGIDGAKLVSGAGICYLVARELDASNKVLCSIGIVGALGDLQDRNEEKALTGLNTILVEDALALGLLKTGSDILVYGRETRPIFKALAYTNNPYLPTLSGHEDNCLTLLTNNGIRIKDGDKFVTAADLTVEEKQKILTTIMTYLASKNFSSNQILDMIGIAYTLTGEIPESPTRDAREFGSLLNACGRLRRPSLGVSICMGDRKMALDEAVEVVANYRKTVAESLDWIYRTPSAIQTMDYVLAVLGGKVIPSNMTSAVSSILNLSGNLTTDRIIVVIAEVEDVGGFKLSSRAPESLLKQGVHLGEILNRIAGNYSGFGGGHNVAAGAYIKVADPMPFLKEFDSAVAEQIRAAASH